MRKMVRFLKRYLASPHAVGAVVPSSRPLAEALCQPYLRLGRDHARGNGHGGDDPRDPHGRRPMTILEVGAGTGAITRYLGSVLHPTDRLDICEVDPAFLATLRRDVLRSSVFEQAVDEGRVRLIAGPMQQIKDENRYDFVLSGLPLTAFSLSDVRDVVAVVRHCLKPGGVFSYFEYVGLRRFTRHLSVGTKRRRIREVSRFLSANIRRYQFDRKTVLRNVPPAHARHWCFEPQAQIA